MFWIVFDIFEIVLDPSRLCESAPVAFCCECCFLLFWDILWSLEAVHVVSSCFSLIYFSNLFEVVPIREKLFFLVFADFTLFLKYGS